MHDSNKSLQNSMEINHLKLISQSIEFNLQNMDSLESFKKNGNFKTIKKQIEIDNHIRFKAKSWFDLYQRIIYFQSVLNKQVIVINNIISDHYNDSLMSVNKLEELFNVKFTFNKNTLTKSDLLDQIELMTFYFLNKKLTPYERYERNKRTNFISSSKLEGIEIKNNSLNESLTEIINRYKEDFNG